MGKTMRQFAGEMSALMPRLAREVLRKQSSLRGAGDLSCSQMAILHLLRDRKSCRMSEIAKFFSVSMSAATGIVARMVKAGFLRRMPDAGDRRIINIRLTAKGKRAINIIFKQRQKMMVSIFGRFSSRERSAYLEIVKKIYHIMSEKKQ